MPKSARPIPVCPIHLTFMVPCTVDLQTLKGEPDAQSLFFRCPNSGCSLVYTYSDVPEGYYKLTATGMLERYHP
jgi:hypothetical protein